MEIKSLKPHRGFVILEPDSNEYKTKSGLIIQGEEKEKPQTGVVVSLGSPYVSEDGETHKWEIKLNDNVLFRKFSPDILRTINDNVYFIVHSNDILAILEKPIIKEVETSRRNQDKADIVQPYTADGKVNQKFIDIYGEEKLKKMENPQTGVAQDIEMQGRIDEQDDYINFINNGSKLH